MITKRIVRSVIAASLACSGLCGSMPAMAAFEGTDEDKISQYEQIVFGESRRRDSTEKRLQSLEKNLLGQPSSGSTSSRLEEIGKLLNGKASSDYLPAVPPILDRSQFNKEPVSPPRRQETARARGYEEAPPAADNFERTTGMLREAMNLYSSGRLPEAERVYKSVLAIDAHNSDANFNLGAIAEDRGDYRAAANYYRGALRSNPQDGEIREALAQVEQKLRQQQTAKTREQQNAAAASDPAMKSIAADAAAEYKKGNFDAALSKLNYLASKSPGDANVQFALGQAWRGKGNNEQALRHLRAAASLNPRNDLYLSTLNQVQSEVSRGGQLTASNDDGRPAGDITPFSGDISNAGRGPGRRTGDLADIAAAMLQARRYGGVPVTGSVEAFGNRGLGFGIPGGISPVLSGGAGNSLRLRRAVQSGLAGAALGAMTNRGGPGGMTRGAVRGAVYGGLFGLVTGGF